MRLLLDTHVLIWWDQGEPLSKRCAEAIRAAEQVYVSAVSGWEIAIKASMGRIATTRHVATAVMESGFEELPLRLAHAQALASLPWHHRDPFDRILVAQAQTEGLVLVTRDRTLRRYDVRHLMA